MREDANAACTHAHAPACERAACTNEYTAPDTEFEEERRHPAEDQEHQREAHKHTHTHTHTHSHTHTHTHAHIHPGCASASLQAAFLRVRARVAADILAQGCFF
jgi:ABC-type Zn2+ transport system substrate-binding protein/surface adhesin